MNKELRQKSVSVARSIVEVLRSVLKSLGWRLAAGLLSAVGAMVFFGWLASEVFEGENKVFDDAVRNAVHQTTSPLITATMIFFTYLGSVWGITAFFAFVSAILIYLHHQRETINLWIMMAGEVILEIILKNSFQRLRPAPFLNFALPSSYGFPSGHAFASLCFFGVTTWLITTRTKNRGLKITVWLTAIFLILIIRLSRIYLGVHYPSDVIAGYAAGLIWLVTVIFGDWWWQRRNV